jgi:hypothetical protein
MCFQTKPKPTDAPKEDSLLGKQKEYIGYNTSIKMFEIHYLSVLLLQSIMDGILETAKQEKHNLVQ